MTLIGAEMCVVEVQPAKIFSSYPLIYGRLFWVFTLVMCSSVPSLQGCKERLCVSGVLLAHVNLRVSLLCSGSVSDA